MRWALIGMSVGGCVLGTPPVESDCEEMAIHEPDGDVDDCDLAACEACFDACGDACAVLESFPPQYACEEGSWSVYDACPDWELQP